MLTKRSSFNFNKTWTFISPLLNGYGIDFMTKFNTLNKKEVAVGDFSVPSLMNEDFLYVSVWLDSQTIAAKSADRYIKNHKSFYHSYLSGETEILILRIPEEFKYSLRAFKEGLYSKMLTEKEIDYLFSGSSKKRIKDVLTMSPDALPHFVEEINKFFNTDVNSKDVTSFTEYSLPLVFKEEVLNTPRNFKYSFINNSNLKTISNEESNQN